MDAVATSEQGALSGMMRYNDLIHLFSSAAEALPDDRVLLAALAYLARFTGSSREHTESDLRWCADRGLDPVAARRPGPEQSTSGGCRKPTGSSPPPSHGGSRWRPGSTAPASSIAVGRAIDRAVADRTSGPILLNSRGTRMHRHAATRRLRHLAEHAGVRITRLHPHMLRHTFITTMLDAGVDLRDVQIAVRHADPHHHAPERACQNLDRHPNYILGAYIASGT